VISYLKKIQYKIGLMKRLRCRLEFKPEYCKKKKKKKNHSLFLSAPCNLPNTAAICLFLSMSLLSSCTLR
jgi:hypothetical protein